MAVRSVRVKVGDRWYTVEVEDLSASPIRVMVDGEAFYVEVEGRQRPRSAPRKATTRTSRTAPTQAGRPAPPVSDKIIRSPMPGRIVAVTVRPGDSVSAGQEVCVVEAMKMEQSIRATTAGVVKAVHTKPMEQVGADEPLVELE